MVTNRTTLARHLLLEVLQVDRSSAAHRGA